MTLVENPLYQIHKEEFNPGVIWLERGETRYRTVSTMDGDQQIFHTLYHNKTTDETSYVGKSYKYKGKADKQTAHCAEQNNNPHNIKQDVLCTVVEEAADEKVMKTQSVETWNKPTRELMAFKILTVVHQYASKGKKFERSLLTSRDDTFHKEGLKSHVSFAFDSGLVFIGNEMVAHFRSFEEISHKIKQSKFIRLAKQCIIER